MRRFRISMVCFACLLMVGAVFSSLNRAEAQRSSRVDATVTPQGNKFLYDLNFVQKQRGSIITKLP